MMDVFGAQVSKKAESPAVDEAHPQALPFYATALLDELLQKLEHFCRYGEAVGVVTGEMGTGKTRLKNELLSRLDPMLFSVVSVEASVLGSAEQLLSDIEQQLRLEPLNQWSDRLKEIHQRVKRLNQEGCTVLLVVDDAENLDEDAIELVFSLIRETEGMAALLLGLPQLAKILEAEAKRFQAQELLYTFVMPAWTWEDVEAASRWWQGQGVPLALSPQKLKELWSSSDGRLDRLVEASDQKTVLPTHVSPEVEELVSLSGAEAGGQQKTILGLPPIHVFAIAALMVLLLLALLFNGEQKSQGLPEVTLNQEPLEHPPGLPAEASASKEEKPFQPEGRPLAKSSVKSSVNEPRSLDTLKLDTLKEEGESVSRQEGAAEAGNRRSEETKVIPLKIPDEVKTPVKQEQPAGVREVVIRQVPVNKPAAQSTGQKATVQNTTVQKSTGSLAESSTTEEKTGERKTLRENAVSGGAGEKSRSPATEETGKKTVVSFSERQARQMAEAEIRGGEWIRQQRPELFTLQVLAGRDETRIRAYVQVQQEREPTVPWAYFETRHQGLPWFVVIRGRYSDRQQAQAAAVQLQLAQPDRQPWIRTFGSIQSEI